MSISAGSGGPVARTAQGNATPSNSVPPSPAVAPPHAPMSQQNLNQIVIDYLAKKGYNRTEAMLRMESATQELDGRVNVPPPTAANRPKFARAFETTRTWVDDNLDIYKLELKRVLWPLFVYSFLNMVSSLNPVEGRQFFEKHKHIFSAEHGEDVRALEKISLPEHVQENYVAQLYRKNKYRIILSTPAFSHLMQFLESKQKEGGAVMLAILSSFCTVTTRERAADERFSFAAMLRHAEDQAGATSEEEGIPGHHPGSAYTGDNPAMAGTLPRLKLGKLPLESALESDVRAELEEEDSKVPPTEGTPSLVQHFEHMIKQEEDEEAPTRSEIPYPPSVARDVQMEVQKVKENRDRFKIDHKTGGLAPGVSVCMFTFHNTYDSVTCLDFSGDNMLVAAGTQDSYIRLWSLDGSPIRCESDTDDTPPQNSRRLYGHSGPVYAVAFAPSIESPDSAAVRTNARWLLSSSADKSIHLWSLDLWQCMVVYKGHSSPVWDLQWGPYGHYFVSGSADKTARLWVTDRVRQQRIFVGHEQDVDCVATHPNSAYIFTGSSDRTVRMWAVTTGNAVRMFTGHTGNITALSCSKSGKYLASADDQGSIIIWDLSPGRMLKRMRGHGKGGIWSLDWSAESTVLVSGGADGTVRIWDVSSTAPESSQQGRFLADTTSGTKIEGQTAKSAAGGGSGKKKNKEVVVTPDQLSAFPTKKSPVYKVRFTGMNLVMAGGAYLP
ncbi:Transcription initiation factor TFIID subunit 5 [Ascosphaera acerosa]|nr:Transcription initiation factor TFIID subunit 5 [Ascosphaera acerosa]